MGPVIESIVSINCDRVTAAPLLNLGDMERRDRERREIKGPSSEFVSGMRRKSVRAVDAAPRNTDAGMPSLTRPRRGKGRGGIGGGGGAGQVSPLRGRCRVGLEEDWGEGAGGGGGGASGLLRGLSLGGNDLCPVPEVGAAVRGASCSALTHLSLAH